LKVSHAHYHISQILDVRVVHANVCDQVDGENAGPRAADVVSQSHGIQVSASFRCHASIGRLHGLTVLFALHIDKGLVEEVRKRRSGAVEIDADMRLLVAQRLEIALRERTCSWCS
jgi:hypothetical protein